MSTNVIRINIPIQEGLVATNANDQGTATRNTNVTQVAQARIVPPGEIPREAANPPQPVTSTSVTLQVIPMTLQQPGGLFDTPMRAPTPPRLEAPRNTPPLPAAPLQLTRTSVTQQAAANQPGGLFDTAPLRTLPSRTVTRENLANILHQDGLSDDLIKMIHQDFLCGSTKKANQKSVNGQGSQPATMQNSTSFVCTLLDKGYMRRMRFREGDLPFPEGACKELAALNRKLQEHRAVLAKPVTEIIAETGCCSCPSCNCCSKNTTRAMKYTLLIVAAIGYIVFANKAEGFFTNMIGAPTAALLLYYFTLVGVPLGYGGSLVYSMYSQDNAEDRRLAAEQLINRAAEAADEISLQIHDILTEQSDQLEEDALQMLRDYVDATPFLTTETEQARPGALLQTYSAPKGIERTRFELLRQKMEIQTGLITHYAKKHFRQAQTLMEKAMEPFIDPSITQQYPHLTVSALLENLSLAIPLVVPNRAQNASEMFNIYTQYLAQQIDFIRLANKANNADQTLPSTALHTQAIQMFPLSCKPLAKYLENKGQGSGSGPENTASVPNADSRERKASVGSDDRRSSSSDSDKDKSTDVKDRPAREVAVTIRDDGKRRASRRPSQAVNKAPTRKPDVTLSHRRGGKALAPLKGARRGRGRAR